MREERSCGRGWLRWSADSRVCAGEEVEPARRCSRCRRRGRRGSVVGGAGGWEGRVGSGEGAGMGADMLRARAVER